MLIGFVLPVILSETVFENEIEISVLSAVACNILSIFIIQRIGLSPIRISFDQERITFDYLKRDLTTTRKAKPILMSTSMAFMTGILAEIKLLSFNFHMVLPSAYIKIPFGIKRMILKF